MSNTKPHTVNITLKDGDILYDKHCFIAYPGDTIEWICEKDNHHLAVHIGWDSPLDRGRYHAAKKTSGKVSEDAREGHYKYFVAVFDGENIWTDDPDFIVKRRP